jgi:hypothetical protein
MTTTTILSRLRIPFRTVLREAMSDDVIEKEERERQREVAFGIDFEGNVCASVVDIDNIEFECKQREDQDQ